MGTTTLLMVLVNKDLKGQGTDSVEKVPWANESKQVIEMSEIGT